MSEQTFPVTVAVKRADGSVEHVRVGSAVRAGDGFRLTMGELSIGAASVGASAGAGASSGARSAARASSGAGGGASGLTFPPYGRSKGAPVAGASRQDLEFYANGCRRTLNDPAKSRWHDKERVLLAAIEAELGGQGYASSSEAEPFESAPRGRREAPPFDDDFAPPPGDDDLPF